MDKYKAGRYTLAISTSLIEAWKNLPFKKMAVFNTSTFFAWGQPKKLEDWKAKQQGYFTASREDVGLECCKILLLSFFAPFTPWLYSVSSENWDISQDDFLPWPYSQNLHT